MPVDLSNFDLPLVAVGLPHLASRQIWETTAFLQNLIPADNQPNLIETTMHCVVVDWKRLSLSEKHCEPRLKGVAGTDFATSQWMESGALPFYKEGSRGSKITLSLDPAPTLFWLTASLVNNNPRF